MNKKKNIYEFLKVLLIIISLIFIYNSTKGQYSLMVTKLNFDIESILLIFLIMIFLHTLYSLRIFFFLKLSSKYNANFIEWSSLYYLTSIINLSPLWGTGHVIRSYELKQNNFSYSEYISMYLYIVIWDVLTYSLLLIYISYIFNVLNYLNFQILFVLVLLGILSFSKNFLKFLLKFLEKLFNFKSLKKNKFFDLIKIRVLNLIKISFSVLTLKMVIYFFTFTLFIFFLDYFLLNSIFKYGLQIFDYKVIFQFFLFIFLINKIQLIGGIIGVRESFLGFYAEQVGMLFLEGLIISLAIRLFAAISLISNYIFYYLIIKIRKFF